MNLKTIKAIERQNRERILRVNPRIPEASGIYVLYRVEDGIKYAYVGQAVNILQRLVQHLSGYQHIDLSLKKHGLYSPENPTGYHIDFDMTPIDELDERERKYILTYAQLGFQLRNKTLGGQGEGKRGIDEFKPARGYRDGLKQGYENARKDVAKWVKRLNIAYNATKKLDEKYYNAFQEFLKGEEE